MSAATEAFSRGLEDVIATESSICSIDGKNSKLFFRGYSVHDLAANSTFEETAFLLLKGHLPNATEYESFLAALLEERTLPEEVIKRIQAFPKNANPMSALRTAVSILALYDGEADSKAPDAQYRKAIRLIAKTPLMIALIERARLGQDSVMPKNDKNLNIAANFLYMLKGSEPTPLEVEMLDKYYVLLAEHDLNASTFAAIITASTESDIYSAAVSAIGTLKGDLHGSANSRAMESLIEVGDVKNVDAFVEDLLAKKKKLMGFGHRVYKGPDPRAKDLKVMAEKLAKGNAEQAKWFAISEKLEKAVYEKKKLYCNVDFYSASVLYSIGIPIDLFTPMFAVSRMSGWCAHVIEQAANNRLLRPVSLYTGLSNQTYVPIKARS